MMKNISVRLEERFVKEAEKLAKREMVDKSTIMREALEKGLAYVRLKIALEAFANGEASTSEASGIADISVGEMMDELAKRGIRQGITKEELKGSLAKALKIVK